MICPALFQALGFAKPAAFLNALHTYFLLLPALFLYSWLYPTTFSEYLTVDSLWWLFPIVDAIAAIAVGFYTWYFVRRLKII